MTQTQHPKPIHLARIVEAQRFGVTAQIQQTICRRMRLTGDGANVTSDADSVTCKFCLRYTAHKDYTQAWVKNGIRLSDGAQ